MPADNFDFLQIEQQRDVLAEHALKRFQFLTLRNDISYIRLNAEDFEGVDDTKLAKQLADVSNAINTMEKEASACLRSAGACAFTAFDVSDFPLPKASVKAKNTLAARGQILAQADPLALALRNLQPEGRRREAFDMGMAAAEGQTLPGPNKQRMQDSLSADERPGFADAVTFSLDRNKTPDFATRGANIATLDPVVAGLRGPEAQVPAVFFALGFDIAAGLFGDEALGGAAHTSEGPGSQGIRDALLSADAQRGFRAAVDLYLNKKHHKA
jgi:hypothetical protein